MIKTYLEDYSGAEIEGFVCSFALGVYCCWIDFVAENGVDTGAGLCWRAAHVGPRALHTDSGTA